MSDIARIAGVSKSTVSHVINATRHVNPDTGSAVRAAIKQTGYFMDGIAGSLRRGKTHTVGLAMSAISNPFFGDVVHAIEREISAAGYSLLLTDTHDNPAREIEVIRDLLARRVDALIIAPSATPEQMLNSLALRTVPTVLIDRVPKDIPAGMDAIGVVNDLPTASLVDHLVQHGHTRIAMVTSNPDVATTVERLAGYRMGLERNNLAWDSRLVEAGHQGLDDVTENALENLLELKHPPTAIVMGNNQVTIGIVAVLQKRQITVPDDIALVAFDDFVWSDFFRPRLTAISQPVQELGARAVEMLLERILDPQLGTRAVRLQPSLRIRESCGCGTGPTTSAKEAPLP